MHSIITDKLSPAASVLILPNEWLWSSQVPSQTQRLICEQMFRNIILEDKMVLCLWQRRIICSVFKAKEEIRSKL